jgi:hypothetical protein
MEKETTRRALIDALARDAEIRVLADQRAKK